MCTDTDIQRNVFLDQVLAGRSSHRVFTAQVPDKDDILRILHAGLLAPFAAAAAGTSHDYFRRFFVLCQGSGSMRAAALLVMEEVKKMSDELPDAMKNDPSLRAKAAGFTGRLALFRDRGIVPGIGTAPYCIVAAERRGFPPLKRSALPTAWRTCGSRQLPLASGSSSYPSPRGCPATRRSVKSLTSLSVSGN